MKPCDVDLLSQYLDGSLMLPQRVALEEHLRICGGCSGELEALQRMDAALISLGNAPVPIPRTTESRIWRSVTKRKSRGRIATINRMMPAAVGSSIAAVLVLLSVNIGVLYNNSPNPQNAESARSTSTALVKQSAQLIKNRRSSAVLGSNIVPAPRYPAERARRIQLDLN